MRAATVISALLLVITSANALGNIHSNYLIAHSDNNNNSSNDNNVGDMPQRLELDVSGDTAAKYLQADQVAQLHGRMEGIYSTVFNIVCLLVSRARYRILYKF